MRSSASPRIEFEGTDDKKAGKPSFKKVKKYKSFTLKQAGYKFLGANKIRIAGKVYKFWKSREIEGKIKTVTVKRTPLGELFLAVVVDGYEPSVVKAKTGKIAGFDFGLRTFLKTRCCRWNSFPALESTVTGNEDIISPQFFKQLLSDVRQASRQLLSKRIGSKNWHKARLNFARKHESIANRRRDWFWKLAHQLTDKYDVLCFETLRLDGMKRLWGRKVSDLGFASFLEVLRWIADKKGKQVAFIDPWYPSSKTCSFCGEVRDKLPLEVRRWRCQCGAEHDRDTNACANILRVGASTLELGDVRQV